MRARRLATWGLLGASLAGAALFVVLRLTMPSDGGRVAFYEDAWSAAGVVISPIDEPQPGLEPGDRVDAVDGPSMDAWAGAVLDGGVARPAGGPLPYLLERDGAAVEASRDVGGAGRGGALLEGWSIVVFSIAMAAVAALVFARRPDVPAATALVLVACGAAGSSVPWFLGATTSDLVQGSPFAAPWRAHRRRVHAHVAGGGPSRPRVPGPDRGRPATPAGRPGCRTSSRWAGTRWRSPSRGSRRPSTLEWFGTWPRIQLAVVVPCIVGWLALAIVGFRARRRPGRALPHALGRAGRAHQRDPRPRPVPAAGAAARAVARADVLGRADRAAAADRARDRHPPRPPVRHRRRAQPDARLRRADARRDHDLRRRGGGARRRRGPGARVRRVAAGDRHLGARRAAAARRAPADRQPADVRLAHEPWRAMRRLGQRLEWAADPDRAFPAIVETVADALRLPYVALEVADEIGRAADRPR